MAKSCKTVEFVFPTQATARAAGVEVTLAILDIPLPEAGKVFRSVTLEAGCTDDLSASHSASGFTLEFALGSEPADTLVVAESVTTTGESSVYHLGRDLTAYFNGYYSESESSARVTITVDGNSTNNHWAKLRITYEYDESSARQVKTIWYPIESTRDLLTTSYQTVGGAVGIPAIKGGASLLPEHDVEVQQVWIELVGNQATSNSTSFNLDLKLGSDGTEQTTLYRVNATLATPGWLHAIWDITDSELATRQTLEAKLTGVTNRVAQVCGWVGITYEFSPIGTTLVWNSLLLPAFDSDDQHGSANLARKSLHVKELWIAEPESITIQPSQAFGFFDDNSLGSSVSLWVGDQSPRSFATVVVGSPMVVGQRIDAGGVSEFGLTLGRGRNRIKIQHFGDVANAGAVSAVNGFMIVNYTSGLSPAGIGSHNQTRHFALGSFAGNSTKREYTGAKGSHTPTIPADRYFLNAVAMQAAWQSSGAAQHTFRVQAQRTGSEGPAGDGAGWASAYRGAIAATAEAWLRWTTADCTPLFRRWAGDPDLARMDVEADRVWMTLDAAGVWVGALGLLVTYHTITQTVAGTVSGTTSGAELRVSISRDATGETVLEATTGAGGVYEAAWYDDTEALVAEAYEDDTHVGRSAPFFAAGLYEPPPAPDPDPLAHSSSHGPSGSDPIAAATTSERGTVQLAADGGTTSGTVVQANDGRLSNARTPTSHASSHASGGSDSIKLDDLATPDDNTDLNASSTRHGLLPKLSNRPDEMLSAYGTWIKIEPFDTQSWATAGTYTNAWVKPSRGTMAMIVCTGGGGGGGGGGTETNGTARTGGCGGGGGAKSVTFVPLATLGSTETVVVGVAGSSGSAAADGGTGGSSKFGTSPTWCFAGGGGGGRLGTTASNGQGGGGGGAGASGSVGGLTQLTNEGGPGRSVVTASEATSTAGTGCQGGFVGCQSIDSEWGGGGGGGRSTTVALLGGTSLHGGGGGGCGGFYSSSSRSGKAGGLSGAIQAGGGGGAAGSNSASAPTAGSAGSAASSILESGRGGGGGGGATNITATAVAGAAGGVGGVPGGGGGGGGAGANTAGGVGGLGGVGSVHVFVF